MNKILDWIGNHFVHFLLLVILFFVGITIWMYYATRIPDGNATIIGMRYIPSYTTYGNTYVDGNVGFTTQSHDDQYNVVLKYTNGSIYSKDINKNLYYSIHIGDKVVIVNHNVNHVN